MSGVTLTQSDRFVFGRDVGFGDRVVVDFDGLLDAHVSSATLAVDGGTGTETVTVSDTGVGIPAEELETIFDEFHQSERTAQRGYGGMGLGLAISRRLVEMHGGRLGVKSSGEEGAGSTFTVFLPVLDR